LVISNDKLKAELVIGNNKLKTETSDNAKLKQEIGLLSKCIQNTIIDFGVLLYYLIIALIHNGIDGIMVSVLILSVVGFKSRSGQTKYYIIGICCFSAKHAALRSKNKDWLAQNHHNASECGDMSIHRLVSVS
jgi:hypothetical protein